MSQAIQRVVYRAIYRAGFISAWLGASYRSMKLRFTTAFRGGAKDLNSAKAPQVLTPIPEDLLNKMVSIAEARIICKKFNLRFEMTSFAKLYSDLMTGNIESTSDLKVISDAIDNPNKRRGAYEAMVQLNDIQQHNVQYVFNENQRALDKWLDKENEQ